MRVKYQNFVEREFGQEKGQIRHSSIYSPKKCSYSLKETQEKEIRGLLMRIAKYGHEKEKAEANLLSFQCRKG